MSQLSGQGISHQNYHVQIKFFVHTSKICVETKEALLPLAAGQEHASPSILGIHHLYPCRPGAGRGKKADR